MALNYNVPDEYYFRIHHIRPRFKNDVENVLIYMASEISKINTKDKKDFMEEVNSAIRTYPGNAIKAQKTIDNWRTEISSMFGLIEYDSELGFCSSGTMANTLAENQDLVEFFKCFLYYFQYPGGHLKTQETLKLIEKGIKFKPATYILKLLEDAEKKTSARFGINKTELAHCIFNDLRVTRDHRSNEEVIDLIVNNREKNLEYDWTGDIIRYAGDILDYMVIADLLVMHGNLYYVNHDNQETIIAFIKNEIYFDKYDSLYEIPNITIENVNIYQDAWFHFINQKIDSDIFKTDIFKYMGIEKSDYEKLEQSAIKDFHKRIDESGTVGTKEIGDMGESLIHGHECMRIKLGEREDLIHLIKCIPNHLAVGYDIQSVELDELKRYIEVKTTISNKIINFNKFHLTTNEWKSAEGMNEKYFVYRLMISKNETQLFIIQDPVRKYKNDLLGMTPRNGADIIFKEDSGQYEELLTWEN